MKGLLVTNGYFSNEATCNQSSRLIEEFSKLFVEVDLLKSNDILTKIGDTSTVFFSNDGKILPLPKYDTLQENYRSWVNYLAPVLVIPSTLDETTLHNTATLLDALSFYSDRDVLPEYYDVVLKGRGAKDAQSVEMLDLVGKTKSFDASIAYGWSRQFSEVLSNTILEGVTDVSSLIGTYDTMITGNIKETLDKIYKD